MAKPTIKKVQYLEFNGRPIQVRFIRWVVEMSKHMQDEDEASYGELDIMCHSGMTRSFTLFDRIGDETVEYEITQKDIDDMAAALPEEQK